MLMEKKIQHLKNNQGAASIFLVIFTMLIITTIVLGFTGIMLRDQSQASDADLSKSAYDSSLAGVEDAKRAVSRYLQGCGPGGTATPAQCNIWRTAFPNCNSNSVIVFGASSTDNSERLITTSASSTAETDLDQAYTCVKTTLDTPDYIGSINEDEQVLIPLRSVSDFNTIHISWFTRDNINREVAAADRDKVNLEMPFSGVSPELPYNNDNSWPKNRPPLLKAQYIQMPASFSLTDFDETSTDGTQSNTNSIFMYPIRGGGSSVNAAALVDVAPRYDSSVEPWQVSCKPTVTDSGYACSATLDVPPTLGGAAKSSAYLSLRPFYNLTNYKVELLNGGSVVNFSGVQPKVDSTGRANDIFRRVSARIEPANGASLMPLGAVETSGNFCKTFSVTDIPEGYNVGDCTP